MNMARAIDLFVTVDVTFLDAQRDRAVICADIGDRDAAWVCQRLQGQRHRRGCACRAVASKSDIRQEMLAGNASRVEERESDNARSEAVIA